MLVEKRNSEREEITIGPLEGHREIFGAQLATLNERLADGRAFLGRLTHFCSRWIGERRCSATATSAGRRQVVRFGLAECH
jgi:hypothetical protein